MVANLSKRPQLLSIVSLKLLKDGQNCVTAANGLSPVGFLQLVLNRSLYRSRLQVVILALSRITIG